MSEREVDHVRIKMRELTERAMNDPNVLEQIRNDPLGALRAAGLPEDTAREYAAAMEADQGEVQGYISCNRDVTLTGVICAPDSYTVN